MNLLKETIEALNGMNHTTNDVEWVGSRDGEYAITWDEFAKIADINYDCGYGGQEVAKDLVIVGDSWWLERHDYDGSEWWEYKSLPIRSSWRSFRKVADEDNCWETLARINEEDSDDD